MEKEENINQSQKNLDPSDTANQDDHGLKSETETDNQKDEKLEISPEDKIK